MDDEGTLLGLLRGVLGLGQRQGLQGQVDRRLGTRETLADLTAAQIAG